MTKISIEFLLRPVHFLALGFGSGLSPKAPGTFGTIAAFLPFYFFQDVKPEMYLAIVLGAFVLGVYLCGKTARDLGVHDHGGIVWDEFVGLWVALFLVPEGWIWLAYAFCLFRLFDIWKPWPISWLDKKCHGGFGIMIDDVVAGLFAWLSLQGTHSLLV